MAIVGSLVSYFVYRLISANAAITSPRRIVAGAAAGYVGINAAALLAGFEFGVQPLLFHDASGAPLYAPYPLSVAIPAMMLAHLTLAGAAEAILTGGIVAYLQRANPTLLQGTALSVEEPAPEDRRGGRLAGHAIFVDRARRADGVDAARADRQRDRLGRMGDRRPDESARPPADRAGFGQYCAAGACPGRPGATVERCGPRQCRIMRRCS